MREPEQTAAIVERIDRSCDRLAALERSMATPWSLRLMVAGNTLSIAAISALVLWAIL